jgi:DNA modification methylase
VDRAAVTHIKDLVADPANRRKHNPRNIGMVVDALQQVGAARSIVIDEDNVILAGNGVTEAAGEAGITKVRVVDVAGDELVAVRRVGLTDEQKRRLAMYDNRAGELASWDADQLREDMANGLDLAPFFTPAELESLTDVDGMKAGNTDPDAVPDERPTAIVAGDLFELGRHRLLCGDSTSEADVARLLGDVVPFLMVTDPPYGVEYDPDWRKQAKRPDGTPYGAARTGQVANDARVDWTPTWVLFPGVVAYVWHAGRHAAEVAVSMLAAELDVRSQIVWRKPRFVISRGHYHWQHEPCWYAAREGQSSKWVGDRSQSTVWDIAQKDDTGETNHGTQKPVECMARPIRNHGGPEDHVYEPFCGSGSTLIACEQLGRRCFAMELEPKYVQMAIDRWEAFTGQKAVKVAGVVPA